jgi:hypothetical protein
VSVLLLLPPPPPPPPQLAMHSPARSATMSMPDGVADLAIEREEDIGASLGWSAFYTWGHYRRQ